MSTSLIIICAKCEAKHQKADLKKHCSNCFACTGCEIYICPNCDERIVIQAPREYKSKKK